MKREKAQFIYWALTDRRDWQDNFNQDSPEYWEIKKARVKITEKYCENKSKGLSFAESEYLACIEWLMGLE